MREIADRIGIDPRDAGRAIKLARTGRTDLVTAVASGRMSIQAALAKATTKATSRPSVNGISRNER
jgi:hypothetical protein